jgi:hypothetical protein
VFSGRRLAAILLGVTVLALMVFLAFQPRVANHFGYALPMKNGLPCRLHVMGRDYDNSEQCLGMNRAGWTAWYDAKHHVTPGGVCETNAQLQRAHDFPLERVGGVSTLFGSSHAVLSPRPDHGFGTTTVLLVRDNGCFRPYGLSGGP